MCLSDLFTTDVIEGFRLKVTYFCSRKKDNFLYLVGGGKVREQPLSSASDWLSVWLTDWLIYNWHKTGNDISSRCAARDSTTDCQTNERVQETERNFKRRRFLGRDCVCSTKICKIKMFKKSPKKIWMSCLELFSSSLYRLPLNVHTSVCCVRLRGWFQGPVP